MQTYPDPRAKASSHKLSAACQPFLDATAPLCTCGLADANALWRRLVACGQANCQDCYRRCPEVLQRNAAPSTRCVLFASARLDVARLAECLDHGLAQDVAKLSDDGLSILGHLVLLCVQDQACPLAAPDLWAKQLRCAERLAPFASVKTLSLRHVVFQRLRGDAFAAAKAARVAAAGGCPDQAAQLLSEAFHRKHLVERCWKLKPAERRTFCLQTLLATAPPKDVLVPPGRLKALRQQVAEQVGTDQDAVVDYLLFLYSHAGEVPPLRKFHEDFSLLASRRAALLDAVQLLREQGGDADRFERELLEREAAKVARELHLTLDEDKKPAFLAELQRLHDRLERDPVRDLCWALDGSEGKEPAARLRACERWNAWVVSHVAEGGDAPAELFAVEKKWSTMSGHEGLPSVEHWDYP